MNLRLLMMLFLSSGCTMLGYLTEQGIGWSKIQFSAVNNEKILDDPAVSEDIKRKILLIGEYKKFFYHYFGEKPTDIYSKTKMLDSKAVSYLVIASKHTEVEATEFNFPLMGSFPYIGFYKKESAKDFAEDLRKDQNLVTYIRPVYAYSTLGYFEDRILSSFFHYDDVELAELVFHELFHTIYFIKDEVELNENLANFYGKELLYEYFKGRTELERYIISEKKVAQLNERIVDLIGILKTEFAKLGGFITDEKADELTGRFLREVFIPDVRLTCNKLKIDDSDCEIKDEWNQASFAAFLTYEEDQDFLQKLKIANNMDLKQYLVWLRAEYKNFKDQKKIESFTEYLKIKIHPTEVPNASAAAH